MKWDDDIHNYYEKLVLEHIEALELERTHSNEFIADLCCLVLNKLPARYIRHEVDMEFYLSSSEREEMQKRVEEAIDATLQQLGDQNE